MTHRLTLAAVAESRCNNLRVVRHAAAVTVIVAHSAGLLTPVEQAPGPLWRVAGPASAMAVNVFFVASGFLVARSLIRGGGGGTSRCRGSCESTPGWRCSCSSPRSRLVRS